MSVFFLTHISSFSCFDFTGFHILGLQPGVYIDRHFPLVDTGGTVPPGRIKKVEVADVKMCVSRCLIELFRALASRHFAHAR